MVSPQLFWPVALALTGWGVAYLGLVVFTFFVASPSHWSALVQDGRITQAYADYIDRIPVWVIGLTLLTAATRFLGGMGLLLQQTWSFYVYALSGLCTITIMFRGFFLADVASVIRRSQVLLEIVFLLLSLFAVWFSWWVLIRRS
ncbi:MAG: hypothetical protein AAGJ86_13460 [Pseudomonadota bacterium]